MMADCVDKASFSIVMWSMGQDCVPLGSTMREPGSSSFLFALRKPASSLWIFNYKNRKMLQGMACRIKLFGYWFFQMSMFDVQPMTSNVVSIVQRDHIDHVGCFAVGCSFNSVRFPSNRAFKYVHCFDVATHLTTGLMVLGVPLIWWLRGSKLFAPRPEY